MTQSPNRHHEPTPGLRSSWEWVLLILILCLAAALRLWQLDGVPPGFTHDEAGHGHDAVAILHGARPIYQTVGYGREPLYDYLLAGLMALAGPTGLVLRFSPVPLSLITLLATFAWVRRAFDPPTALATTALQAASFWSLATGRQALRSGLLPALVAAAVYFYWRWFARQVGAPPAGRPKSRPNPTHHWRLGLFALLIGATLYTYIPARVLWLVFPTFLIYLALFHREALRRTWPATLLALSIGLLLAAPLFAYLRAHPEAEQRLAMLDAPLRALMAGDPSVMLERTWSGIAAFFIPGQGDDFLAYNIPGRPIFDPLTGALFLVGVGLCLARWRRPAYAFAAIWFLIGVSPSLVTGAPASITRSIGALPVALLFPALAVVAGARWATARWGRRAAWTFGLAFAGLVAVTGALSARDYLVRWGRSPHVRAAYQHTLVETANYLDGHQSTGEAVALSTVYPHAPHDPYVFEMALRRDDLATRWFDAHRALLIPSQPVARLVAPSSAPLEPYFASLPGLEVRERVTLHPDDLDPFFVVYEWQPPVTRAALEKRTRTREADFGSALRLIGYDLLTPEAEPGGSVELVTLWQVTDPRSPRPHNPDDVNQELVLFTHALDGDGRVVAQEDRLDAPSWDWRVGDVIAQLHRFPLPPDLPPQPLALEVGVYRHADLTRLPVLERGQAVADHVLLTHVEVRAE